MGGERRRGGEARRSLLQAELGPAPIGATVVRNGVGDGPPAAPLAAAGDAWAAWLGVADAHRLASMTLSAQRVGALDVPDDVLSLLGAIAFDEATMSLAAEHAALTTIALLRAHGCHPVLLKGASIAQRFYPRPADRPTRDVDLLLPDDEVATAWELLRRADYVVPRRGMDPAWVSRYAKGRTLIGPDGTEVDLHRTLTALPFGLAVDLAKVWAEAAEGQLAGRPIAALSAEATFFHCCLHAALEFDPVLLAHLDVVVLSRADLDLDRVRRLVGVGPLTSVVRAAVDEAALLAPVDPSVVELAGALPPSAQGDRLLDWYRRRHRSFRASLVRAAPLAGGPVDQIKYGAAVLVGVARMATGSERP